MPFTPSHCEALSQDGKFYIGQHMQGGMMARPVGYDDSELMTLPDGTKSSRIVSLPCSAEQEAAFYDYVHDKIGMPYDWISILGFAMTEVHLHLVGSLICSAIMTAGLRSTPAGMTGLRSTTLGATFSPYFSMPLTVPFHKISPRDLFLMLSSHVEIDH
jgi:hypothetical protein